MRRGKTISLPSLPPFSPLTGKPGCSLTSSIDGRWMRLESVFYSILKVGIRKAFCTTLFTHLRVIRTRLAYFYGFVLPQLGFCGHLYSNLHSKVTSPAMMGLPSRKASTESTGNTFGTGSRGVVCDLDCSFLILQLIQDTMAKWLIRAFPH